MHISMLSLSASFVYVSNLRCRGSDQAPPSNHPSKQAISSESIPKSVARVLNAAHIRQEWREKKRKHESGEDTGEHVGRAKKRRIESAVAKGNGVGKANGYPDTKAKNKMLGIQPGESLGHFNRSAFPIQHIFVYI